MKCRSAIIVVFVAGGLASRSARAQLVVFDPTNLAQNVLTAARTLQTVINTLQQIELMKSQNCKKVTDNCLFKEKAFTLGADGKPKGKCMMGDNADCDRCGCVVPYYMATMNSPRLLVKEAFKKAVGRN